MDNEKKIGKLLNKSYLKAEGLLKRLYENEYNFQIKKNTNYSHAAHDLKDELLKELDSIEGIMSMNMRGTRKRSRNNNKNSNNNDL
jgi:hypothetical protein